MTEGRKQAVSLRVTTADLRKIKELAQRLGGRDSDVIRFALKTMFARLAPLCDHSVHGRALLPVFIEAGTDLFHHFDLDTARLEEIVNDGVSKAPALANERLGNMEDALAGRLRGYIYSKSADKEPASDPATK